MRKMKKNKESSFWFIAAILFIAYIYLNQGSDLIKEENKITTILDHIEKNYVDSIDVNSLIESTISQTLTNLDPHSTYLKGDDVASTMASMQGSFEGIGVEFSIHRDTIIIINVIPNGPSEKKGLKSGERIIFIEEEEVAGIGISNKDVISKLRGKRGTYVKVGVQSPQDTLVRFVSLKRDKIPLASLDVAYEINPQVGYIKLNRFSATTFDEFKHELKKLKRESSINSLILDLRGNSGGYLDQAIKILNEFFGEKELLVYTKGNARRTEEYFANTFGDFQDGNLCILIDEGSASASEIVAGAVQDHDRGLIIGERSFGKGLVQEQIELQDGSLMRLTVSRYYTPSGRCIQKPYLENQSEYFSEAYLREDSQLVDTLQQFNTMQGRVVYGGGGIMPDHIVKSNNDSLPTSLVYLYTSSFFNNLAFDYADNKRRILSNDFENFEITNNDKKSILQEIEKWIIDELGNDQNTSQIKLEIQINSNNILERFSALIIRQLWGWSEMQIFLNQNDEVITSSLSLLKL
ncbi:MAG: peptidase S41 [Flavobacteriales bacterium]|nr:peptidase S41 [Flavobacteriales bacterium]